MKTNMATTSLESYYELIRSGKANTQRCAVLKCILDHHKNPHHDGITRRSIGTKLGMELGTVAGRVKELVDAGAVVEDGTVQDPRTGKQVKLIKLVGQRPKPQPDLFDDHPRAGYSGPMGQSL